MDEPTQPMGAPELWRVSTYLRAQQDVNGQRPASPVRDSRFASLSASLLADLDRFADEPAGPELLEVMAACLRHSQNLALHVRRGEHVLPLTVFPRERVFHCPIELHDLLESRFDELHLLQCEPAVMRPPGDENQALAAPAAYCHPVAPLLWQLALRGPRSTPLPEITGPAVFRVAPDMALPPTMRGALGPAVQRLREEPVSLRALSNWPGMDRERATRLLNALYVQSGLIVSRAHPAAGHDSWFGMLTDW